MGVTLICGVVFAEGFEPVGGVDIGEEGVGLGWSVVNTRQAEAVGKREGFAIDGGTADDEDVLRMCIRLLRSQLTVGKGFRQGAEEVGTGKICGFATTRKNDVATIGQCAVRKGTEGVAAHDDGITNGK